MKLLICLLFSLTAFANSADDFKKHWKVQSQDKMATIWKALSVKDTYATVTIDKKEMSHSMALKEKGLVEKVIEQRKLMVKNLGGKDYKISDSKLAKIGRKNHTLYIKGSYKDKAGKEIAFLEAHNFTSKRATRIFYRQENAKLVNLKLATMLFVRYGIRL